MSGPAVVIELFGLVRARAGRREIRVQAGTAAEALAALAAACPALAGASVDGRLAPQYLLSPDGEQFVRDLSFSLHEGDRLLLFSADAGG
jgi:hypothetical protein